MTTIIGDAAERAALDNGRHDLWRQAETVSLIDEAADGAFLPALFVGSRTTYDDSERFVLTREFYIGGRFDDHPAAWRLVFDAFMKDPTGECLWLLRQGQHFKCKVRSQWRHYPNPGYPAMFVDWTALLEQYQ